MVAKKTQRNPKVVFRVDPKTLETIDKLQIPVVSIGAKVRYLMMRGIEVVQKEKATLK
jgi:hypothetical protein